MHDFRFKWDPAKNRSNRAKHGVSFEEATTVFRDEGARFLADTIHSVDEERFVLLGMSSAFRILVVCHCYRESESVVRIFSARPATPLEQRDYARYQQ
jgi:uncharacterized protein